MGWKAIGAHFGRDRTTAIRWANQRGLPVHAVPGGKTRSVYALRYELDGWAAGGTAVTEPRPMPALSPEPAVAQASMAGARWRLVALVAAAVLLVATILVTRMHFAGVPPVPALPHDPALASRYIEARDDLAQRDSASLQRALQAMQAIAVADPRFAPAQSGLAEAYLLEREYGVMDDPTAFPLAMAAATRALRLDPGLAAAYRDRGFVEYWWSHDRSAVAVDFHRALAIDRSDAVTRLWYANILADNGDAALAAGEFTAAKLFDPGSPVIAIDEAWAIWSRGDDVAAQRQLERIARQHPTLASTHDCLAMTALARGDLAGYARETTARAALRHERALDAYARAVADAVARRDMEALSKAMAARARIEQSDTRRGDLALAAFFESGLGRRAALLAVLGEADRRNETWGSAGFRRHIARRWGDDHEIMRSLARRSPPLVG